MNDNSLKQIQSLCQELENCPPSSCEDFLIQLPDAGLIHAATDQFPRSWFDMALLLLQQNCTNPGQSQLDKLLAELLEMLADMIDQGRGEFLALGVSQLQLTTLAMEGLEKVFQDSSEIHRSIHPALFRRLEELESMAALTHLDGDAVEQLQSWKDSLPDLPEHMMIPAVAQIVDAVGLNHVLFLDHRMQKFTAAKAPGVAACEPEKPIEVDFTARHGSWVPSSSLAAASMDDNGDSWNLVDPEQKKSVGSVFTDGTGFWSVELTDPDLEVRQVFLDHNAMERDSEFAHVWDLNTEPADQPSMISLHVADGSAYLIFHRKSPGENSFR
jgi:hypothetical protein